MLRILAGYLFFAANGSLSHTELLTWVGIIWVAAAQYPQAQLASCTAFEAPCAGPLQAHGCALACASTSNLLCPDSVPQYVQVYCGLLQEQYRQRKRDRGLVVDVQLTLDLEAQGEVQFNGIMGEFLKGARVGRDRLDVASEEVMVLPSSHCFAVEHICMQVADTVTCVDSCDTAEGAAALHVTDNIMHTVLAWHGSDIMCCRSHSPLCNICCGGRASSLLWQSSWGRRRTLTQLQSSAWSGISLMLSTRHMQHLQPPRSSQHSRPVWAAGAPKLHSATMSFMYIPCSMQIQCFDTGSSFSRSCRTIMWQRLPQHAPTSE